MWWVEHAFGRARADARPEEDTRVRIFVILSAFSVVFVCLTLGAVHAALLTAGGRRRRPATRTPSFAPTWSTATAPCWPPTSFTTASTSIRPRSGTGGLAATQIRRALPRVSMTRLNAVLFGDRRLLVVNRPDAAARRWRSMIWRWAASPSSPRTAGSIRWASSRRHVIGSADTGGEGISGAELAFNDEIRAAGARGEGFPLSIDLRVQGVLENELAAAADDPGQGRGRHHHRRPDRRGPGHGQLADVQLAQPAPPPPTYEMGSVFKTFTVAAAIDTGRADMNTLFDASRPSDRQPPHHRLPRPEPGDDAGGGLSALVQHRHLATGGRDGRRR